MLNTKKIGKLISKLLVALFIFSMFVPQVIKTVSAGNTSDTLHTHNYLSTAPWSQTSRRAKQDYTSSYGYNKSSSRGASKVDVLGCTTTNENELMSTDTYGTPKSLPVGSAYYFPNLVKERNGSYASLRFFFSGNTTVSIWWSPDSY